MPEAKGPVRKVFTGVISLIREGMTPILNKVFCSIFGNPNPNPTPNPNHYNWIMSGEHTSTAKTDHEATEEHDWLIVTGTMSGETTSNRKRKQETTTHCKRKFLLFQESIF